MKLRFLKRAERQLQLQQDWWAEHAGAAELLMEEVRRVVALLKEMPHAGALVKNSRPGTRRVFLRTKHVFYYRVNEKAGVVEVMRVWHMSRGKTPKL
jgi:plasmid stabilization system protein ParE